MPAFNSVTFTIPGSKERRQFTFQLKKYGDATVEFVPNRPVIAHEQKMTKGAATGVVTQVPDPSVKTTEPVTTPAKLPEVRTPEDDPIVKVPEVKTPEVTVKQPEDKSIHPPPSSPSVLLLIVETQTEMIAELAL